MDNEKLIAKTIEYIEENLDKELKLDDISDLMNYSKFHLNRLFSEKVGCTIHKYIQMRRLTEAAERLVNTDMPIIDIALEANYNSQQSFTFAFKQEFQYPPQVYRAKGVLIQRQSRFIMYKTPASRTNIMMQYGGMAA